MTDDVPLPSRSGAAIPREPRHGTIGTYNNHRCRQDCPGDPETGLTCRQANAAYRMVYRARKREAVAE